MVQKAIEPRNAYTYVSRRSQDSGIDNGLQTMRDFNYASNSNSPSQASLHIFKKMVSKHNSTHHANDS